MVWCSKLHTIHVCPCFTYGKGVTLVLAQRRAKYFVGLEVALDTARVEPKGEPGAVVIPEFRLQCQECASYRIAASFQQGNVGKRSFAHGFREVQVKLQEV